MKLKDLKLGNVYYMSGLFEHIVRYNGKDYSSDRLFRPDGTHDWNTSTGRKLYFSGCSYFRDATTDELTLFETIVDGKVLSCDYEIF